MEKEKLVTPSFCAILAANFLLYFGFWLLTPILPFYLSEVFHTSHTAIGVILSCYTISSLCIRPFSGYIWGIERSGFFNDRGKWVKSFENQTV